MLILQQQPASRISNCCAMLWWNSPHGTIYNSVWINVAPLVLKKYGSRAWQYMIWTLHDNPKSKNTTYSEWSNLHLPRKRIRLWNELRPHESQGSIWVPPLHSENLPNFHHACLQSQNSWNFFLFKAKFVLLSVPINKVHGWLSTWKVGFQNILENCFPCQLAEMSHI